MIRKALTFLFSIYGFLVFLVLMFILLPFFIIAFCLPSPANGNIVFVLSRIWARAFFLLTFIRFVSIPKTPLDQNQEYIFVCNHISYIDIPMMILATQGFNIRILGKAEMGKIPIFGFIYKMGTVSVQRSDPQKRNESIKKMKSFLDKNISIMICPEGTFNMTRKPLKEFYDGAFRISIECQKPIVPIIFPDTYDRLSYQSIFSLTPGRSRAIILQPISPDLYIIDDLQIFKEEVFEIMQKEILQFQPSWVSRNPVNL